VLEGLLVKNPADRLTGAQVRDRLARVAAGERPAAPVAVRPDDTAVISRDELAAVEGGEATAPAPVAAPPPVAPPPPPPPPAARPSPRPPVAPTVPAAAAPVTPSPRASSQAPPPVRPTMAPPGRTGSRRPAPAVLGLAVLVVVALVAVVLIATRSSDTPQASGTSPTSTARSASPSTTTAPSSGRTATTAARAAPAAASTAGWVPYSDPSTGFTISKPANWAVRTDGTLTDFRDPDSGAYLRVDHVQPAGPSPEGAWQDEETGFAADNANYHRIRIDPTTYSGYRAAIWEFTYTAGGADLRVANLGFITPHYGFALYFQTRAGDWNSLQPIYQAFKDSFKAPA
jgi:hypothetical protein